LAPAGKRPAAGSWIKKLGEFTLEVLGLGAAFDHLQHEALWQALQHGDPYTSIRNSDPKFYPWSAAQKLEASVTQAGAVFARAVHETPIYWVAPLLHAAPDTQRCTDNGTACVPPLQETVALHPFALSSQQPMAPERIVEQAFFLFDTYPDLPYVVVFADNSLARRERTCDRETASAARDGYHLPATPDTVAVLVLGRCDRVAALRSHAWDDPKNDYIRVTATRALQACVPQSAADGRMMPAMADWLACAFTLGHQPLRYDGAGPENMKVWDNDPPQSWRSTPWLPVAWTHAQLACFDKLTVLAQIHRPVHIVFADGQGTPLARNDCRLDMLMAGWREAVGALPAAAREAGPARVIASTGNNERQLLALHGLLHRYAAQGGPEIDTADISSFMDTGRRLGDTGAATLPLQLVLGAVAVGKAGGASAIIHMLEDGTGATIVFVTPIGGK
jgi:hypothetical protein